MSRSGYSDECDDQWASIRWRGAVQSSIRGKRGQAFLGELLAVLDAMEEKTLVAGDLEADGEFCALGAVGKARGVALGPIDTEDWGQLSKLFGISEALAREIMYQNDESVHAENWIDIEICGPMRPGRPDHGRHQRCVRVVDQHVGARRWHAVRCWVAEQMRKAAARAESRIPAAG